MRRYRIKEQSPLKTKRLIITPMTAKELEAYTVVEENSRLHAALAEMRRCVDGYPDEALWHTGWRIALRATGETVGLIAFHGVPADRTVELGYDILPAFRGNGYAQEAASALCNWAFARENVYFIRALADEANAPANRVLEKLKFYRVESPVEGQNCWELERPASAWLAVYMSIGLAIGLSLGESFFGTQILGMVIGMSAGLALGAAMDSQDRAARKRDHAPKRLDAPEPADKKRK